MEAQHYENQRHTVTILSTVVTDAMLEVHFVAAVYTRHKLSHACKLLRVE